MFQTVNSFYFDTDINLLVDELILEVLYDNTTTNFKHKPFRIRLYFCWKDDATNTMDDNADTIIGEKAANGEEINFKISASISFNQYIS